LDIVALNFSEIISDKKDSQTNKTVTKLSKYVKYESTLIKSFIHM